MVLPPKLAGILKAGGQAVRALSQGESPKAIASWFSWPVSPGQEDEGEPTQAGLALPGVYSERRAGDKHNPQKCVFRPALATTVREARRVIQPVHSPGAAPDERFARPSCPI